MTDDKIRTKLEAHVNDYIQQCREFKYYPRAFIDMIKNYGGAVGAIKKLFNQPKYSDGFARLWKENRLDLTMEALILENKEYQCFFTDEELEKARKWLKRAEYQIKE